MTSPDPSNLAAVWQLFRRVASSNFFDQLRHEQAWTFHGGIYTLGVVVWLMIHQRLDSKGTLCSTVQWLARNCGALQQTDACLRVRQGNISTHTGGYCQARQKLPTLVATCVMDHVFEQLAQQMREDLPELQRPVFVVDGSTVRTAHEKELVTAFPPGRNRHGDNHWPVMGVVVFHDVYTGLAARPSWGAMYGKHAVSEQYLAQTALSRLPADAIVMGDRNFGIFGFAHAVHQTGRPVLLRLTAARAQKVLGGTKLRTGRRRKAVWTASRWDRKAHPELPADASVAGWVMACRHPSGGDEMLYFFTTLDLKPARILKLYKLRWNIETDLRSLKRTVGLHQLTSKTTAMVEKELLLAVTAYNLVRAVMWLASRSAGLTPRQLSFSAAQDAVMAAWPDLQRARTAAQIQREMERLVQVVLQTKLPQRSRERSYPRAIWGRGGHFPLRASSRKGAPK